MNILILGSGGREHALSWKVAQSPLCKTLFVGPGNAGTSQIATNVDLKLNDFPQIARFCVDKDINLIIVGPEDPLVMGIIDFFKNRNDVKEVLIIGPDAKGAQLEGSKNFSKKFMQDYNIPTAAYQTFTKKDLTAGKAFLGSLNPPYVLKADGLAAGKGVLIIDDLKEAEAELENMLAGKFGLASHTVVIEEFLDGTEFSVFVLTDGESYKILPVAKDYKRIGEGDKGLNTGGMGAISPVSFVDSAMMEKVEERIIKPTIKAVAAREMDYKGFIFIGLINVNGEPKVIEYNVRLGDPETEVVIPRIKSDIVPLLLATAKGELKDVELIIDERYVATVMTVSEGYPGIYEKGKTISGLENVKESVVFHAGTKMLGGKLYTNGGRVMAFTSFGRNKEEALKRSYASIDKVCYDGIIFRRDIGYDL